MYMLDGEKLFDVCFSSFHHEWQIDEILTKLITNGEIDPLIVTGSDSPGARRGDEYIPLLRAIFTTASQPQGKLFPEFLATEVLPLVARGDSRSELD